LSYLGQSITILTGCGERTFYADRERQKKMRHETDREREDEVLFAAH